MTQEQKELLLKDLCARLPYGVKIKLGDNPEVFELEYRIRFAVMYGYSDKLEDVLGINYIKPYLFPLSSMTEEQKVEYDKMSELDIEYTITQIKNDSLIWTSGLNRLDWLLKNHFDVYGLIPMGLAIDATGLNIY